MSMSCWTWWFPTLSPLLCGKSIPPQPALLWRASIFPADAPLLWCDIYYPTAYTDLSLSLSLCPAAGSTLSCPGKVGEENGKLSGKSKGICYHSPRRESLWIRGPGIVTLYAGRFSKLIYYTSTVPILIYILNSIALSYVLFLHIS
jgi:hypothetical protein